VWDGVGIITCFSLSAARSPPEVCDLRFKGATGGGPSPGGAGLLGPVRKTMDFARKSGESMALWLMNDR